MSQQHKDKDDLPAGGAPNEEGEIPRKRDDSEDDKNDPFKAD